jgi:hypothetical protein
MLKVHVFVVEFGHEIEADLNSVSNCHCSQCRKASGAAFSSGTRGFRRPHFVLSREKNYSMSGNLLRGIGDVFAVDDGSPILKRNDARPETIRLRLGTLDSDPGVEASIHLCRSN